MINSIFKVNQLSCFVSVKTNYLSPKIRQKPFTTIKVWDLLSEKAMIFASQITAIRTETLTATFLRLTTVSTMRDTRKVSRASQPWQEFLRAGTSESKNTKSFR